MKSALVTGGGGVLGRAIAERLVVDGYRVYATCHKTIPKASAGIEYISLDLADKALRDDFLASFSPKPSLHLIVHAAGAIADGLLPRIREEEWDRLWELYVGSAGALARYLEKLSGPDGAHLVLVGSIAGINGGRRGLTAYAGTKGAMTGLGTGLAAMLGPKNIRVNTLLPGCFLSPLTRDLPPKKLDALKNSNSLERLNDPAEVAGFISWLATTSNISGQLFNLDSRLLNYPPIC